MKKAERLSDAIGKIDDDIIEKAELRRSGKAKRAMRFPVRIIAPIAACLAVVIAVAAILPHGLSTNAVAEAVYPKATKHPGNDASDEWYKEMRERYACESKIDDDVNEFCQKTAEKLLSSDENRAYSPVNVYMALSMLAETTDGESRRQLLDLLGAESIDELRENAKNLWGACYRNDGLTTSILANSLWLNENVKIKQKTPDILAESYYASTYKGDPFSEKMAKAVRDWLNEQTNGLLSDSVKGAAQFTPEMIMALYSTVYFRAKWDNKFDKADNDTKTFHAKSGDIQTEFMNATKEYAAYYMSEDFGAVSLHFEDGGAMWFFLPDEGKTIDDVLNSDDYIKIMTAPDEWENKRSLKIHYSIPKFDVSSNVELSEELKSLGVTDIFDFKKAGFSPLTDTNAAISKVNHAARVVIDEEGCTAAAFTEIMYVGSMLPEETGEIFFTADRPFVFAITSDTSQPLFIGTVTNP